MDNQPLDCVVNAYRAVSAKARATRELGLIEQAAYAILVIVTGAKHVSALADAQREALLRADDLHLALVKELLQTSWMHQEVRTDLRLKLSL